MARTTKPSHLKFHWEPQPAAQKIVDALIEDFLTHCPWAKTLAQKMHDETGTRFKDWIDHISVPTSEALEAQLVAAGFEHKPHAHAPGNYECHKGLFPNILLSSGGKTTLLAIKVDCVIDFLTAHDLSHYETMNDGGDKGVGSRLRMGLASRSVDHGKRYELWVIERHGLAGFDYDNSTPEQRIRAAEHLERFRTRRRDFEHDMEGYIEAERLVNLAIKDLGKDWTCDLFFHAERLYWMKRNRAAQVQYARQQKLGLGWANHDHHTYRCSRENFVHHVAFFEKLGFKCRESFYAGAEAGWGAQVLEHDATKITTFNDVDMDPEELFHDFSHEGFHKKSKTLGTIGVWVGLHGEAMCQAGMHHLECQFDWHALVAQLERAGNIKHMAAFTTFPYLRQAFTEGERWMIEPKRIKKLQDSGHITRLEAEVFLREGAIGSHLETLERNDGFKGFNQKGVSDIISRTDPRKHAVYVGA